METNSDGAGTLADVAAAARAGRRAASPWWLSTCEATAFAAMWSAIFGSELTWRYLVVVVPLVGLLMGGLSYVGKRRGVRNRGYPRGSWAARIDDWWYVLGIVILILISTPMVKGDVATYAILFVVSFVLNIASGVLARWVASREAQ